MTLSILSVNYLSDYYLNKNVEYIYKYNDFDDINWFVVNNQSRIGVELDSKLTVISGVKKRSLEEAIESGVEPGSMHHADSINKGLQDPRVKNADYTLIVDPDFFITEKLSDIILHMKDNSLTFYGAEYTLNGKNMITDFPVAYCMFIDTKQVDCSELDFSAGFSEEEKLLYDYYPDVGHRVYRNFKLSSLKFGSVKAQNCSDCGGDYFPGLGIHFRMKLHREDDRFSRHKKYIQKMIEGKDKNYRKPIERLEIRRTEASDALDISRLRHDPEVYSNIHTPQLFPSHDVEKWIKSLGSENPRFTVVNNGVFVGLIRIDHLDLHNNTCYIGLDIAKESRGRGYSKKIYEWIFNYLFNSLGMRFLYLEVLEDNKRAIQLYEKLGFKECGRFPKKTYNNGHFQDSIIMFLSKETYLEDSKV